MGTRTPMTPGDSIKRGRWAVWLTHPSALLLTTCFFVHGLFLYDSLPGVLATHWGADGSPDGWSDKSFGSVFMLPLVSAGLTVFLALISALVVKSVPVKKTASEWELYRREGMLRGTVAALGFCSLIFSLLFGGISALSWTQPDVLPAWPILIGVSVVLLAVGGAYAVGQRWSRKAAARAEVAPTPEERAEDQLWVAGILYNNPQDPHIMVRKREGTGYGLTVNIGNRKGRYGALLFLALVLLAPVGLAGLAVLRG